MSTKHFILPALLGAVALSGAGTAFAREHEREKNDDHNLRKAATQLNKRFEKGDDGDNRGIVGTITAISGTRISITAAFPGMATGTIAVDAASSTVKKAGTSTPAHDERGLTTQALTDLAVGEHIAVRGERTSSSTIRAAHIIELPANLPRLTPKEKYEKRSTSTEAVKIRGGVVGTVRSISSSTLMLHAMNGTDYTVNIASTSVRDRSATSSLSSIVVGERVAVHGKIEGATITATVIMKNIPDAPQAGKKDDKEDRRPEHAKENALWAKLKHFFWK